MCGVSAVVGCSLFILSIDVVCFVREWSVCVWDVACFVREWSGWVGVILCFCLICDA